MAVSSSTTLGGIQDKIVADVAEVFMTSSVLFDAVDSMSTGDALVGQFHTRAVPSAVSAHTEGAATTATTITLTAKSATLEEYPIMASLSPISNTPKGLEAVTLELGGALARTIDTAICAVGSAFDSNTAIGTVSGEITLDNILTAKATLDATGYTGQLVCVLSPKSFKKVAAETLEITNPTSDGQSFMRTGKLGTIAGVEIYQSPWVDLDDTHTSTSRNFMCFKHAIGLAYRDPIIQIENGFTHGTTTYDWSAISMFKALEVTDSAGIVIYDCNA